MRVYKHPIHTYFVFPNTDDAWEMLEILRDYNISCSLVSYGQYENAIEI